VTADGVADAIDQLALEGPDARRPLADRVQGSRFHNMKELRPPSSGRTEIRLLFAFDPTRERFSWLRGTKRATGSVGTGLRFLWPMPAMPTISAR
jgi:hypothetical protein